MPTSIFEDPKLKPPLDESFYALADDELAFFKSQTGIEDEEASKQHIIDVQAKAYEIYGYPCIRTFSFLRLKISHMPAYETVLKLTRERKNAILLDIGCCFGNDIRKVVADGWPIQNVIASDLRQGFWDYGHELFKSTSKTFPAAFVPGDAFDPAFISPRQPFYEEPHGPFPTLGSLTSLTPVQGHISAIHASSFFHLFDEAKQLVACRQVASLLSPIPGSIIFGSHAGHPETGWKYGGDKFPRIFCHSPESWSELWNGEIFKKGTVKVHVSLKKYDRPDLREVQGVEFFLLWFSITRL